MLISVIVCTHNLANYQNLAEAVEQIPAHALKPLKIVIAMAIH
jgi:glycosyltransferase involved in cell wall biosynthesis